VGTDLGDLLPLTVGVAVSPVLGIGAGASWAKLLLGLALLAVGVTPAKALAVGLALAAVNPKNC
jgi:hypothetical protein